MSSTEGRVWAFSGFACAFLSRDILLDGFLQVASRLGPSELEAIEQLPRLRTMMEECVEAADYAGNSAIRELTDQVLELHNLWEEYLAYRRMSVGRLVDP
jgi:hypothetical protein